MPSFNNPILGPKQKVLFSSNSGQNNIKSWYNASQKLGCGGLLDGEQTLDCMRHKSVLEIMNAIHPANSTKNSPLNVGPFQPYIDNRTLFPDYQNLTAAGEFVQNPLLIGNTEYEMATILRSNKIPARLKKKLNVLFSCPTGNIAAERTRKRIATWRFSYAGDYPNQVIAPDVSGPWHGSDVGMIFGTNQFTRNSADTPEQQKLGKKMREAWTFFAKNPTTGLNQLHWPRYDLAGR
jgi:cholinesterase